MRALISKELESVAGGDWSFEMDFGVVKWEVSGPETIQELASSAADAVSAGYWASRDAMADFYEWAVRGWEFSARCGM